MSKESYIPIPEVNSGVIRAELILPFGIESSLGINVRKVETLCQIAGLRYLAIMTEQNPDHSQVVPLIVGVDSQGTAVSGGAKVTKVPTFTGSCKEVNNERQFLPYDYKRNRWAELEIRINTEEMQERLLRGNKIVRSPSLWAEEMDAAVRQGIVRAGIKFLLDLPTLNDKLSALMTNGLAISSSFFFKNPIYLIEGYLLSAGISNVLMAMMFGTEKKGEGSRITFIFGPEIDRAIALCFASLGKPLIKEINPSQD